MFTGPDGAVYGKQDDLNAHRLGIVRITRLEPSEERIQRFGPLAVVSVRMEMSGTFQGPFGILSPASQRALRLTKLAALAFCWTRSQVRRGVDSAQC